MKRIRYHFTILLVLLSLLIPNVCPVRAAEGMRMGNEGLKILLKHTEFSSKAYKQDDAWYIGYGSKVAEKAYPDGITEEKALELLKKDLEPTEEALNTFFSANSLTPTQAQFDALADFTFTLGTSWLNGSSDLLKIVRGNVQASRRETARAFGIWSHVGGSVLPDLADRRMEEAALYLDGSSAASNEFAWLSIARDKNAAMQSDFAVYQRGQTYDAFPRMIRLGWKITSFQVSDSDTVIHLGDTVTESYATTAIWEKNTYDGYAYKDVKSDAWYYHYVMDLTAAGILDAHEEGKYAPDKAVTVGEALTFVARARGIQAEMSEPAEQDDEPQEEHPPGAIPPEAAELSGQAAALQQSSEEVDASGGLENPADVQESDISKKKTDLLSIAKEKGFLTEELLADPDAPLTRKDAARLAVTAMGFGRSFSNSPFSDVDDCYVTALSETGLLEGAPEADQKKYRPDDPMTRAELSSIVWRLWTADVFGLNQTVAYSNRQLAVSPDVPYNSYDLSGFSGKGKNMTYHEDGVTVRRGIDVSRYQGTIDWKAVKEQGIDFAILRVGGRYQISGAIYDDAKFIEYYKGAKAAGLMVGAYFYSQAISAEEAVKEAEYVISKLKDKDIDAPVVFDWETAGTSGARTNKVSTKTITDCAVAYCERVKAAGYTPMVYMMRYDGYMRYDLSRLLDYDWWYAGEYNGQVPRFFYDFQMWQYTASGTLKGISEKVDMDLWMIR